MKTIIILKNGTSKEFPNTFPNIYLLDGVSINDSDDNIVEEIEIGIIKQVIFEP